MTTRRNGKIERDQSNQWPRERHADRVMGEREMVIAEKVATERENVSVKQEYETEEKVTYFL